MAEEGKGAEKSAEEIAQVETDAAEAEKQATTAEQKAEELEQKALKAQEEALAEQELPGKFSSKDFALSIHPDIFAFRGNAQNGFEIATPHGLIAAVKDGIDNVVASGGKIRFNLDGFDPALALDPNSARYMSNTSQEYRYVTQRYLSKTIFYRAGAIVAAP